MVMAGITTATDFWLQRGVTGSSSSFPLFFFFFYCRRHERIALHPCSCGARDSTADNKKCLYILRVTFKRTNAPAILMAKLLHLNVKRNSLGLHFQRLPPREGMSDRYPAGGHQTRREKNLSYQTKAGGFSVLRFIAAYFFVFSFAAALGHFKLCRAHCLLPARDGSSLLPSQG
jgi:hypothetical protein